MKVGVHRFRPVSFDRIENRPLAEPRVRRAHDLGNTRVDDFPCEDVGKVDQALDAGDARSRQPFLAPFGYGLPLNAEERRKLVLAKAEHIAYAIESV